MPAHAHVASALPLPSIGAVQARASSAGCLRQIHADRVVGVSAMFCMLSVVGRTLYTVNGRAGGYGCGKRTSVPPAYIHARCTALLPSAPFLACSLGCCMGTWDCCAWPFGRPGQLLCLRVGGVLRALVLHLLLHAHKQFLCFAVLSCITCAWLGCCCCMLTVTSAKNSQTKRSLVGAGVVDSSCIPASRGTCEPLLVCGPSRLFAWGKLLAAPAACCCVDGRAANTELSSHSCRSAAACA